MLVMHYFGVTNSSLIARTKSLGIAVISDVTHILLNRKQMKLLSKESDYLMASLRKSGTFPDGGFILNQSYPIPTSFTDIRIEFVSLRTAGLFYVAQQDNTLQMTKIFSCLKKQSN